MGAHKEQQQEEEMLVLGLGGGLASFLAVAGEVEKQDDGGKESGGHGGSRIGPAVLFVVVIVAAVLVVSGLLHLLVRFLLRRGGRRGGEGGGAAGGGGEEESALQRQLQQLFHLHDAGLDQDVIDALPVFLYREVVVGAAAGAKEPFDCAVCLCEFAAEDRLRLLPLCGHAFHIDCIDTWLLSNSTCPLCRCALGADDALLGALHDDDDAGWKHEDAVLPVRLGKFKNLSSSRAAAPGNAHDGIVSREAGETSSSSMDARRCYSMGSYQYVLAEASLQVSVHRRHADGHARARLRGAGAGSNPADAAAAEGKRIGAGSKGDSFSVSKIWQWPRNGKGKLPVLASDDSPAMNGRLPWQRRSPGDS